jgi:hypothetical protein
MACSKRHERFDHERSLNNYCACLSAAGNIGAAFIYSALPKDKTLQIISSRLVPSIIRMTLSDACPKGKTIVVVAVCFSWQPKLRWLLHIDIREPSFQKPYYGYIQMHMEACNMPHQQAEVEAAAVSTPA